MNAYTDPSDGATRLIISLVAAGLVGVLLSWWWTR